MTIQKLTNLIDRAKELKYWFDASDKNTIFQSDFRHFYKTTKKNLDERDDVEAEELISRAEFNRQELDRIRDRTARARKFGELQARIEYLERILG